MNVIFYKGLNYRSEIKTAGKQKKMMGPHQAVFKRESWLFSQRSLLVCFGEP